MASYRGDGGAGQGGSFGYGAASVAGRAGNALPPKRTETEKSTLAVSK